MISKSVIKKAKQILEHDRILYVALLEKYDWDREKARKAIKMSRATFFRKLKDLELTNLTVSAWKKL